MEMTFWLPQAEAALAQLRDYDAFPALEALLAKPDPREPVTLRGENGKSWKRNSHSSPEVYHAILARRVQGRISRPGATISWRSC
jgi:hypothetical protein